jgi:hypothetical protein
METKERERERKRERKRQFATVKILLNGQQVIKSDKSRNFPNSLSLSQTHTHTHAYLTHTLSLSLSAWVFSFLSHVSIFFWWERKKIGLHQLFKSSTALAVFLRRDLRPNDINPSDSLGHGKLTTGEGSVQLTSSLR